MGYEKSNNTISESLDPVELDNTFKQCIDNLAGPQIPTETPLKRLQLEKFQQTQNGK